MIDSLCYSSRKVPGRCENSFVNYRINYQKLCDSMKQIRKNGVVWHTGKVLACSAVGPRFKPRQRQGQIL